MNTNENRNGYFVLNKPAGMTSAQAIAKLKKFLPKKTKIGHTGTLDPNVTGVLPVAIGQATKSIAYLSALSNSNKKYRVKMQFGYETDTLDIWGRITQRAEIPELSLERIMHCLEGFSGAQMQIPPMYSALKKDGMRLYDLAREGVVIERQARKIEIVRIDEIHFCEERHELCFDVVCSKGTYVRSLCADIGRALGTLATMTALTRLQSDCFTLQEAISLDEVDERVLEKGCLDLNFVFCEFPAIEPDFNHALHVLNGVKVDLGRFLKPEGKECEESEHYRILYRGRCIAFASAKNKKITAHTRFYCASDLMRFEEA